MSRRTVRIPDQLDPWIEAQPETASALIVLSLEFLREHRDNPVVVVEVSRETETDHAVAERTEQLPEPERIHAAAHTPRPSVLDQQIADIVRDDLNLPIDLTAEQTAAVKRAIADPDPAAGTGARVTDRVVEILRGKIAALEARDVGRAGFIAEVNSHLPAGQGLAADRDPLEEIC